MTCRTQRRALFLLASLGLSSCGDDVTASHASTTGSVLASSSSSTGTLDGSSSDTAADSSGETGVIAGPECGNGFVEANEDCDDGNRVPNDGCSKLCRDEYCGDGVVQPGEVCDLGSDNADTKPCTAACQENVCGDGLHGSNEGCDDGNTNDDDGCGADCRLESCGNGELEAGETCDDGNQDQDDGCTTLCAPPVCGDGVTSTSEGENCDDGNADNTDTCPNDCSEAVCGDGALEGSEECDDAEFNGDGTSQCSSACTLNTCGDGYLVPEVEACDDGDSTGDGVSECSPECSFNVCGDAYHHFASEGCDAGGSNGFVPCSTSCELVPEVVEIAFGGSGRCARYADGSVRCWGSAHNGGLGLDPPTDATYVGNTPGDMPPAPADLGGPVVEVVGGQQFDFYCARRPDGAVLCWGDAASPFGWYTEEHGHQPYNGHLGPIEEPPSAIWLWSDLIVGDEPGDMPPEPIPLGGGASVGLSVGGTSVCSVMEDGSLRCWGHGHEDWPTLGYGANFVRAMPEHFPPPSVNLGVSVVDITHSSLRTCVLGTDQQVRCFGISENGWLGDGNLGLPSSGTTIEPPAPVDLGIPIVQISDGVGPVCGLGVDGSVRCFGGSNTGYEAGYEVIGDELEDMPPAPLNLGATEVTKLVGAAQQCVLSSLGEVHCWGGAWTTWGHGFEDQIVGDAPGEMPPPALDLGGTVLDVFSSKFPDSFCAILEDHSVTCWGSYVTGLESGGTVTYDQIGDEPDEVPPPRLRLYE